MTRNDFRQLIESRIIILDGATGTELAKRGMPQGVSPEYWVFENPAVINEVQQAYCNAGSDIVYAPTFGANRLKLAEFGLEKRCAELNRALTEIAREGVPGKLVFGDIAPTGVFAEPFGELPFEELVAVFKEQVQGQLEGGVDGFAIETMMDLQEARAAVLAIRELCDLPVIVTLTFDEHERTLMGNDPLSSLITLQALGADAFGCNCSTGPENMIRIIRKIKPHATIPLVAKPNAGLPMLIGNKTVFPMSPVEFGNFAGELAVAGANLVGGCCGTTPEHIRELAANSRRFNPVKPLVESLSAVSSSRGYCLLGGNNPFAVVGERINPTGKKAFQAELREGSWNLLREFAISQNEKGAAILDVNFGLSGIDEKEKMCQALNVLAPLCPRPLCIDSVKPEVIEAALRVYPGRAMVNSISAEKERIEKILPIAAKYGAMFILLPLTDGGIPETVEGRIEVVKEVFAEAQKYGYRKEDICVDALIMAVSSSPESAKTALALIQWCTEEFGVNTICGLSNVSFGMPNRSLINTAFLGMAMGRGLNMAIANPSDETLMAQIDAGDALFERDPKMLRFVGKYANAGEKIRTAAANETPAEKVCRLVIDGDEGGIEAAVKTALENGIAPGELMDSCLIKGISRVGELYEKKIYFLPQLLMSAETMRKGFQILEPYLTEDKADSKARPVIVVATVEGDIHDIGKNIVVLMLKNYGFEVVDLGKDVPAARIIETAEKSKAVLIGLSALMTTTMVRMKEVVTLARESGLETPFMIGGAVVDRNYADEIGAHYVVDAMASVRLAKEICGN